MLAVSINKITILQNYNNILVPTYTLYYTLFLIFKFSVMREIHWFYVNEYSILLFLFITTFFWLEIMITE